VCVFRCGPTTDAHAGRRRRHAARRLGSRESLSVGVVVERAEIFQRRSVAQRVVLLHTTDDNSVNTAASCHSNRDEQLRRPPPHRPLQWGTASLFHNKHPPYNFQWATCRHLSLPPKVPDSVRNVDSQHTQQYKNTNNRFFTRNVTSE